MSTEFGHLLWCTARGLQDVPIIQLAVSLQQYDTKQDIYGHVIRIEPLLRRRINS
jgi:hypothetical protein